MQYKQFIVRNTGLSATNDVNKFLAENPMWHLWQVVPFGEQTVIYVLEGPSPKKPDGSSTPGGALREGATLSERVNASNLRLVA